MATTLKPGAELGDYRIVAFLGAGGMGEVYRAVHTRIGREAAIKVLTADASHDEVAARFENEARIQANLEHDNVAALYDYIDAGGRRCLVMEFVPGESLAERLRRARLEASEALGIVEQVATAAAYMHARGIVHRDLKPSNIRITPGGRVKVLDFGIARSAGTPPLTAAGQVVGTPEYVSPEQLRTGAASPRSDVWSLGVLLHEMVTGHVPFAGQFPNQVWSAIQQTKRVSVAPYVADAAAAARVDRILDRCLETDPTKRFATADGLLRALRRPRHADAGSTPAASAKPQGRFASTIARHWPPICVAAALLMAFATLSLILGGEAAPPGTTRHRIVVTEGTADVSINGNSVGRTPYEYRARHGEVVSLELRRPGFEPIGERFDISARPIWTFTMRPAAAEGRRR